MGGKDLGNLCVLLSDKQRERESCLTGGISTEQSTNESSPLCTCLLECGIQNKKT